MTMHTTTKTQPANMGLGKKTIKLVNKILTDDKRRAMYSDAEILFMERQLEIMKLERKRRKQLRKQQKGFANE